MVISLGELLHGQLLAIQFEVQQEFQRQIVVEASAAKTDQQRKALVYLQNNARAIVDVKDNALVIDLSFLSIPDEMKDYAELIRSNAKKVIIPRVSEKIRDTLTVGEARDIFFDYVKQYAAEQVKNSLGGVS